MSDIPLLFRQSVTRVNKEMDLGFSICSEKTIEATKIVPVGFSISLSNFKERLIKFVYYPIDDGIILIYIEDLSYNRILNMEDWLRKYNKLPSFDAFKLGEYNGINTEHKWDEFVKFLEGVFELKSIRSILKGDEWEDIPIDWNGIK